MVDLFNIDERLSNIEVIARDQRLIRQVFSVAETNAQEFKSTVVRLESTVSHIESDVKEMKTDIKDLRKADESNFRILFSSIIFVTLGLASLMAKGFGWL